MNDNLENLTDPELHKVVATAPRLVPVEVRAHGFYARWDLAPDKLDALLQLVGDSILEAQAAKRAQKEAGT